jgi:ethanolamine transporter EutH
MPYIELDITNKEKVEMVINEIAPYIIIYCAVWIAVDIAEDDKVDIDKTINDGKKILGCLQSLDYKTVYLVPIMCLMVRGDRTLATGLQGL